MTIKLYNFYFMKIILLDSIRSMQNVGAIFRNADWSWFEKIILTWFTPIPPRGEIAKTALWSENTVVWEFYEDPIEVIDNLKKEWYKIISVELTPEALDYRKYFWKSEDNICLIMWNEVSWVSKELLDISDEHIMVPMLGQKNSLNVSVAAWIVMYAFV